MYISHILVLGLGLALSAIRGTQGASVWQNQAQDVTNPAIHHDSKSVDVDQSILSKTSSPSSPGTSRVQPQSSSSLTGGGCYRERCWTWCDFAHEMWCYTTEGTTWDGKRVECEADYECEEDWPCAERCRHKYDRDT